MKILQKLALVIAIQAMLTFSQTSFAHHNPNVHYDRNQEVEIAGILTEVNWRSPHVQLTLMVTEEDGTETEWHLDSDPSNTRSERRYASRVFEVGAIRTRCS